MTADIRPMLTDICFEMGQGFHQQGFNAPPEQKESALLKALAFYYHALSATDAPYIHEAIIYALLPLRDFAAALPHCTKAMEAPEQEKKDLAQYNRGLCYLMTGDYINGFKDYDTRMRMGKTEDILRKKIGVRPMWDGKPCDHLLVYGEQGMGDLFMFARLIRELINRNLATRITFEVPPYMENFMEHNFPEIEVVGQSSEITPSDEHILLISLARLFEVTLDTIPDGTLEAEPAYIQQWSHIKKLKGLRVGICWAGRSEAVQDLQVAEWNSRRSITLKQLAPLFDMPDITWVSLQKGVDTVQLKDFPQIREYDIKNWSDTAGIMENLDLVISIDSGPVHLAGALGRPTLLLNHKMTCWRWNLEGESAPWYSSVHVLRQETEGDWTPVLEKTKQHLLEFEEKQAA